MIYFLKALVELIFDLAIQFGTDIQNLFKRSS